LNTETIAITGGIGSGKSAVLAVFASLRASVFNADAAANEIYMHDTGFADSLEQRWGKPIFDESGKIDKARIAEIVFLDQSERKWLESTIHPLIENRLIHFIEKAHQPAYAEIPLLFECGWQHHFSHVVAVWARPQLVLSRLMTKGLSRKEIDRRMQAQLSACEKLENAEFAIVNNGSFGLLSRQCAILHAEFTRETTGDR